MDKLLQKIIFILLLAIIILPFATSARYVQNDQTTITLNIRKPNYTVRFHSNRNDGDPEETTSQSFVYGTSQALASNTFTNAPSDFLEWNTLADGSGVGYDDEEVVNNLTSGDGAYFDLYAQWGTLSGGIAAIGNTVYQTLQAALNAVPNNNTATTVRLLANTSENIKILSNQNVILNLGGHTNSVSASAILSNSGELLLQNGTLTSSATNEGAVNNSGRLTVQNATITMTAEKGKQAIYNLGDLTITGNSYISSASKQSVAGGNTRSAIQSLTGSTLTILSGSIISPNFIAINNSGDMVIGTEDGNPNPSSITIRGETYGVRSTPQYAFYDGTIMGKTKAIDDDSFIADYESGYDILFGYETINNSTYEKKYLGTGERVDFDPNGGQVNEPTRFVTSGEEIDTLPEPTWVGHDFDGWYTESSGGQQVTEHTVITGPATFYAHWTESAVARIGNSYYSSLQNAVNAVPKTNVQTTVVLLRNTDEAITTKAGQNILFDLQNYTLTNTTAGAVIENYCTLEIQNGTITSQLDTGTINNNKNSTLTISGGQVIATGSRQAVYNNNLGTVYITGTAYLSARTSGTPTNSTMGRGTVQNLNGGTMVITGGTIVGLVQQAVSNEGNLTIGEKNDGNLSITSPEMRGETYGVVSTKGIKFYDGIAMGITGGISGTISDQEPDTVLTSGEQLSGEVTYKTEYLVSTLQQNNINQPDMQMMMMPAQEDLLIEPEEIESGENIIINQDVDSGETQIVDENGDSEQPLISGEEYYSGDTAENEEIDISDIIINGSDSGNNEEINNSDSQDGQEAQDSNTEPSIQNETNDVQDDTENDNKNEQENQLQELEENVPNSSEQGDETPASTPNSEETVTNSSEQEGESSPESSNQEEQSTSQSDSQENQSADTSNSNEVTIHVINPEE